MYKAQQQIAALNEQLEGWAEAFEGYLDAGQEALQLTLPIERGETEVSPPEFIPVKYAVSVVMDIRGRLLELVDVFEAKWPNEARWCGEERLRWPLHDVLGRATYLLERKEDGERLVLDDWAELSSPEASDDENQDREEEYFKSLVFGHRDIQARLFALQNDMPNFRPDLDVENRPLNESFSKLGDKRASVVRGLRRFARNEGLVPWVKGKSERAFSERYAPIFECIRAGDDRLTASYWLEDVRAALAEVPEEIRGEAERVLGRIFEALEHFGFDELSDEITANGGQLGPESSAGSSMVNIIPGDGSIGCFPIALAVGRTGREYVSTDLGIRRVMRILRRHLLDCNPITRVVIIMTDRRQRGWEEESRYDLRWHKEQGKKVLILETEPLFGSGPRLREI